MRHLVVEMDRLQLDGIDIDLEGNGSLEQDRESLALFVDALSAALKHRRKLLTVDSFHSPCFNAPHMGWWDDWKGRVDAIHSIGYGDLYEGSTESFTPEGQSRQCMGGAAIFRFSWQVSWGTTHGFQPVQILLGLPGGRYEWGSGGMGSSLLAHLEEVSAEGAGICIWDVSGISGSVRDPGWGSEEAWSALKKFTNKTTPPRISRHYAGSFG